MVFNPQQQIPMVWPKSSSGISLEENIVKLAFDFGITNTDIVSYLDGEMKFFSHPSEEINEKFLKLLN